MRTHAHRVPVTRHRSSTGGKLNNRPHRKNEVQQSHFADVCNAELLDLLRAAGLGNIIDAAAQKPSAIFTRGGRFNKRAITAATGLKRARLDKALAEARQLLEEATH